MGEEIPRSFVDNIDSKGFCAAARAETQILRNWFDHGLIENDDAHYGLELEGCLVDCDALPATRNMELLKSLDDPAVVPELARFNFEINSRAYCRAPNLFRQMLDDLDHVTTRIRAKAHTLDLRTLWVGILPTLRDDMLTMENITPQNRYYALTQRVMELKKGSPVKISIDRFDSVDLLRKNIMSEAAATSLQIHSQTRPKDAVRAYNASLLLSGPCVALMANSPFLYGRKLWDETRIPVFEQSLAIPRMSPNQFPSVTFGKGYVKESIIELFESNLADHQVILPIGFNDDPEKLRHLKFLNGQIWRWVRPIIGVGDGLAPHFRIEQRCFPSGPSHVDIVANIAFYLGSLYYLTHLSNPFEAEIPFADCRDNFYQCAKLGMKADIKWTHGHVNVQTFLMDFLLEKSKLGLIELGIDREDIEYFVGDVIRHRIRTGWTGAAWQKSFIDLNGTDFQAMTQAYMSNQLSGAPVYQWRV